MSGSSTLRLSVLIQAVDRLSGPLRAVSSRIDALTTPARRVADVMNGLGRSSGLLRMGQHLAGATRQALTLAGALTRVSRNAALVGTAATAAGAFGFNRTFVRTASDFEQMNVRMRVNEGGNQERAASNVRWIEDFAQRAPYTMREVFDNFVRMQQSGMDPRRFMGPIGDMAAGASRPLEQAVEAFNDAVGGEFERLREFGIRGSVQGNRAVLSWMQGGQQQMLRNANNPRAIAEMLRLISRQRFPNAMEEMSRTWEGQLSNLEDHWSSFQRRVMGSGVFDWMKQQLQQVLDKLNEMTANGTLDQWARSVGSSLLSAFRTVRDFVTGYDEVQAEMGTGEVTVVGRVPGIIERLEAIFGRLREFWVDIRDTVTTVSEAINSTLDAIERRVNALRFFFSLPSLIPGMLGGGAPAAAGAAPAPGGAAPAVGSLPPIAPSFSEGPLGRLLGYLRDRVAGGSAAEEQARPRGSLGDRAARAQGYYADPVLPTLAPGGVQPAPPVQDVRVNAGLEVVVRAPDNLGVSVRQTSGENMQVDARRGTMGLRW